MEKLFSIELPNGKHCEVTSATMRTIVSILRWETFDRAQYRHTGFDLRPGDTIIDIGANVGIFALWASPLIPEGRLLCVEPIPAALKCLETNVRRNELRNVTIVAAAVGARDGSTEFISYPGWEALAHRADIKAPWFLSGSPMGKFARWAMETMTMSRVQTAAKEIIAVREKPLPLIMDENGIQAVDFLKLDCEGGEYEILRTLDSRHFARIERLVVECHDYGREQNHKELVKILLQNGFECEVGYSMQERLYSLAGIRVAKIWAKRRR